MRVITFGEILLRLQSPGFTRMFQDNHFETSFCGGEANVAVSLALFGLDSAFVTKLPDTDVGEAVLRILRYFGVYTSKVVTGDGRLGLYYSEKGASQRGSKIIYDRAYSAISLADRNEFDWNDIFDNANWFHWTGINPALSDSMAEISMDAVKVAKEKGITISCDLNYRKKLWSPEKAKSIIEKLMPYVDVCIANEEDADKVLGIKAVKSNVGTGELNFEDYKYVAKEIYNRYGCKYTAITLRKSFSASDNGWSAIIYDAAHDEVYKSKEYNIHIVDRVGGGDSFAAGLIYGLVKNMTPNKALEFAVASSCLKHTIEGDFNRVNVSEVMNLVNGDGSGRVSR